MSRSSQHKYAWEPGDLSPDWLALADASTRERLTRSIQQASQSREQEARRMLAAPPWPSGPRDASARALRVVAYLEQR